VSDQSLSLPYFLINDHVLVVPTTYLQDHQMAISTKRVEIWIMKRRVQNHGGHSKKTILGFGSRSTRQDSPPLTLDAT